MPMIIQLFYGLFYPSGLGYGMVIVSSIVSIYYNIIITWVLYYLFKSFTSTLPWSECGHWWNTPLCLVRSASNVTADNVTLHSVNETELPSYYHSAGVERIEAAREYANVSNDSSIPWKSPAEEFWQ